MTPAGMVAFRKSAALVHTLPGLRLRITHDGTPLAELARDVMVRCTVEELLTPRPAAV